MTDPTTPNRRHGERTRVLVIGQGSMGRRRVRNLLHVGGIDVAAFEPASERREQAAVESGIRVFATFDDGLAWHPDALVISTPPDRHHEYALRAAELGLHFFTEASVVPGETRELIAAVAGKPIVAAPSCTLRFHPGIRFMRRRIAGGAIGRPLLVLHHVGQHLADWHPWEDYRTFYVARRETGPAREIVPFELNWMTYLFGELTSIEGICDKVSSLEVDVDDVYAGLVRFESGVTGTLVVEVVSRPAVRSARIVGEDGTLVWDFGAREVREWDRAAGRWIGHPDPPPVEGPGGAWVAENMYIEEMRGFLGAIGGDPEAYPFSLEQDDRLLKGLAGLEYASAKGHRVPLS
jgi:predicted dehydrogenase